MPKHIVYTKVTPLPSNVPRQLALDMLHAHGEIIGLNPLVTNHNPVDAPRNATRDEYFAQWYEIEEVITWGLGMRKKIKFKGVFHDMPWGLQTHIYAPMGVDLRNKYIVGGNQPGEPKETRELGIDTPAEGLYLRMDVEIMCNIALSSFVKKETKQTLETMIDRMTKKAELLDDGVLEAMFEDGRLKTRNPLLAKPGDHLNTPSTATLDANRSSVCSSSPSSPLPQQGDFPGQTYTKYSNLPGRKGTHPVSMLGPQEMDGRPISDASSYARPFNNAIEMEGSTAYPSAGAVKAGAPVYHAELADTSMPARVLRQASTSTPHADYSIVPAPLNPGSASPLTHSRVPSATSSYVITNPDQPRQDTNVSPRFSQGPLHAAPPVQPMNAHQHYSSDSKADFDQHLTDHVAGLNISGVQAARNSSVHNHNAGTTGTAKCPICGDFEGDSAAVSHHVNRAHFN